MMVHQQVYRMVNVGPGGSNLTSQAVKINKILLIHSAHHDDLGNVVSAKGWFNRLTIANPEKLGLLLLAAYTPAHIEVKKIEDYFEDIPWDSDAEVVGIHAQIMQLSRAREIALEFKKRGKIVLMGGFLPTMHPESVEDCVDAICLGEGDLTWPQMLRDIEQGHLKKRYKASTQVSMDQLPVPRYDLVYKTLATVYPVQATRGCPFVCDYCSIIQFFEKKYRLRPVEHIIRDIKATGSKNIYFTDDNLMENKEYIKELYRQMKSLDVMWGTQCTINIANDPELLRLAYEAGCRWVAVGVESLSQKNLLGVSKGFNRVDRFADAFAQIQNAGIAVHALIVFGFPEDRPESFLQTVEYLEQSNVAQAEFFIYTPYEKTPAGKKVFDTGQIRDYDLNHYRESYVVFEHPKMTAHEIQVGYWWALREFYSLRSICARLWRGSFKNKPLHLLSNFYYWIKVRRGIVPVYFGKGNQVPSVQETNEFGRRIKKQSLRLEGVESGV